MLDEAHAVLGPGPSLDGVDVLRVGTLSKTLGALGGFVAGPARYTELLVNRARSYIFTTASTPADAAAALAALRVLRSPEGDALRARLRANVDRLRPGHPSPIVPYVCGSEARPLGRGRAARRRPARHRHPPADGAAGTRRLRVALSAAHTAEQVDTPRPRCASSFLTPRPMTRPGTLVFVTGTGTDVGKTWWTGARRGGTAHAESAASRPQARGSSGDDTRHRPTASCWHA